VQTIYAVALLGLAMMAGSPALACMSDRGFDPAYVSNAESVVIGRVSAYEIVEPNDRSYARFRMAVDEVISGNPPRILTVTWDQYNAPEYETLRPGSYLIALRDGRPQNTRLGRWSVLQQPCAPPFIWTSDSRMADDIRHLVEAPSR
jgi:hypothetical protein